MTFDARCCFCGSDEADLAPVHGDLIAGSEAELLACRPCAVGVEVPLRHVDEATDLDASGDW